MRRGDLFKLTWEKIDFQRGLIYVPNSKTGRDDAVPMNEDVRSTLQQIRRTTRGGGHVFINPDTAKPYTDIKTAFGTACQLAGIENLHWHDLRHTFGTRLAEAGSSEATIADLMGHSDPQTTRRYTHATEPVFAKCEELVDFISLNRKNFIHKLVTRIWRRAFSSSMCAHAETPSAPHHSVVNDPGNDSKNSSSM